MRIILGFIVTGFIAFASGGCKSEKKAVSFCDTACLRDTLKFVNENHPLKPYVYISPKDCVADTLIWSYNGMGANRKMDLPDMIGDVVRLNKHYVRCVIVDTSYAWLLFNDCSNGRGYYLKIPFAKSKNISRSARAINNLDPKFSVAEGLVAYTDQGNIFVEEMATGKKAMMTLGEQLQFDFNAIHNTLDSVNISPSRIWVKVKLNEGWKELEKSISMK
ncbi:MAG: hypothetical protein JST17_11550 [Bacteroidetes bacterium]|nr:hypothetical protein [Bacteroidota bacterium]MBS1930142.1 hypothetical protein [Bacteroidota bacterium]